MNRLFVFILTVFSFSCATENENSVETKEENTIQDSIETNVEILDDKVIAMVDTLDEVVRLDENIQTNSKGKNNLTIWISAKPEETKINYYWVKVGEDNGLNIATHYNFYVNPIHEQVLFYDVVNDTLISLDDWRKK